MKRDYKIFVHRKIESQSVWVEFMVQIKVGHRFYDDPLLIQMVCHYVFESVVKTELPTATILLTPAPTVGANEKKSNSWIHTKSYSNQIK